MARLSRLVVAVSLLAATLIGLSDVAHASDSDRYVVKNGDSLSSIAANLHVELHQLLAANEMRVTSLIVPGQRLVVPGSAPSTSGGSGGSGHTVAPGDTLSGIATRYRVSLAQLLAANEMRVTSLIVPGQRLVVPGSAPSTSGGSGASGHTVAPGDTLSGIATRYRVSLAKLLAANDIRVTSLIVPGMELTLPAGVDAPATSSSGSVGVVVDYARAQLGKQYRFFAAGPASFDCSGLTMAAYARVGIPLVHHSASQARQGTAVDFQRAPIRPGDLVFLDTNGDGIINHVGIAITATSWIQAPGPGEEVRLGPLPPKSTIVAVRRLLPAG